MKNYKAISADNRHVLKNNGDWVLLSEYSKYNDHKDVWNILANIERSLNEDQINDLKLLICDWEYACLPLFENIYSTVKSIRVAIDAKRQFIAGSITVNQFLDLAYSGDTGHISNLIDSTSTAVAALVELLVYQSCDTFLNDSATYSAMSSSLIIVSIMTLSEKELTKENIRNAQKQDLVNLFIKWETTI